MHNSLLKLSIYFILNKYLFSGVSTTYWDNNRINEGIGFVRNKEWDKFGGTYGKKESKLLYDTVLLQNLTVIGKSVLVIGSINPWVEIIFLALGAKQTITLEYNKIISHHPQVIESKLV